jgi:hypothetical protein
MRSGAHRTCGRSRRGPAVVGRRQLAAIGACRSCVRCLARRCGGMRIMFGRGFLRSRPRTHTSSPVETCAITTDCIVHHGPVIGVVNDGRIYMGHGRVVSEMTSLPLTSKEANAHIPKAIVDASIEADMRAPIAGMEDIGTTNEAPIRRRPEQTDRWRRHPNSRHPVVASRTIGPVARVPEIPVFGGWRLHIHRQGWRRNPDRDADANGIRCHRHRYRQDEGGK